MKKTARWGLNKVKGWFGFEVPHLEAVDLAAEFVKLEDMLTSSGGLKKDDVLEQVDVGRVEEFASPLFPDGPAIPSTGVM